MRETKGTEQREKMWYEKFEEHIYKGVSYKLYEGTPNNVEPAIRAFLDKMQYSLDRYDVQVLTEGSSCFMVDLYMKNKSKDMVTENDVFSKSFIISKQKFKDEKGLRMRVRHIIMAEKGVQ